MTLDTDAFDIGINEKINNECNQICQCCVVRRHTLRILIRNVRVSELVII